MTSQERFKRVISHREADRVPIHDSPWAGTIRRWEREGMPAGMDYRDYFEIDKVETIGVNISPNYEVKTIEETDKYIINTTEWGVTVRNQKQEDSTPEFLDYKVSDASSWEEAKARMTVDESRLNLEHWQKVYPKWRAEGRFIEGLFWFGFDVAHSWMSGTVNILAALALEPDWVKDIIDTFLDRTIAHYDMLWDKGYRCDSIMWYDDMGYKGTAFFSNETYRSIIQPAHIRAVNWAHEHGITARLHSCGNIMKLLPDVLETGVDILNPLEVKAGMDVPGIKRRYGSRLTLHGGIDAVLWDKHDAVMAEIESKLPLLKENGGYIFASDHSIPNTVSLKNMTDIVELIKRVGKY